MQHDDRHKLPKSFNKCIPRKHLVQFLLVSQMHGLLFPLAVNSQPIFAAKERDTAVLRALVNIIRAQGGVVFLLDRIRNNQVQSVGCKQLSSR